MECVERNLEYLLSGKAYNDKIHHCDFTLDDQNEIAGKFN